MPPRNTHTGKWTDRTPDRLDPVDGQDTLLVSCPVRPLRPADKTDNGAFGAFVHTANVHSSGGKILFLRDQKIIIWGIWRYSAAKNNLRGAEKYIFRRIIFNSAYDSTTG